MPTGPVACAAAIGLAALAVAGYQGTGAQVTDRRQLLAQVVAACFEFLEIWSGSHGVSFY